MLDPKKFRQALLAWYNQNKRDLPFRRTRDPYKIWLSEIMLQQTTMNAVIPYYERFTAKYPDIASVANANDADILALWQGLGYYSRIRNFKIACRQIVDSYDGAVPADFDNLRKLKGIGDYTAAAIASIAFGKAHAVVDGNVKRVLARLFLFQGELNEKPSTEFFAEKAVELLDEKNPGDYNQAVMELGAIVCRPKSPLCLTCPVAKFCLGKDSDPESLPLRKKMEFIEVDYHSLIVTDGKHLLLKKPSEKNLIRDMWELPGVYAQNGDPKEVARSLFKTAFDPQKLDRLGSVRHGITNKKITTHVYQHPFASVRDHLHEFVSVAKLGQIPLNTLSKKILARFFS